MTLLLVTGAWAGTETILYNFGKGKDDGRSPIDSGALVFGNAGNLLGTTSSGGTCSYGTVFRVSPEGKESVLHSFCNTDGAYPQGSVTFYHGSIYGTTEEGGTDSCGTVFKLSGHTLTTLYSFACGNDGKNPMSGVVLDRSENVYGTTLYGGTKFSGVVYKISRSGDFSVIYNFCSLFNCADGSFPHSNLIIDKQGNLYGTTQSGGPKGSSGVPFRLAKVNGKWKESVIGHFQSSDGTSFANESLTFATHVTNGNKQTVIFGAAHGGGAEARGTVFEITGSKGVYKTSHVLYSFTGTQGDGEYPNGSLVVSKGAIFGTTLRGGVEESCCGTIFKLTQKNGLWTETILHRFTGGKSDGSTPYSGLASDAKGNLYGVTHAGGSECSGDGCGVVFSVQP
jgi:uncharacterized repeat protein (TIGR03803 family)